MQHLVPEGFVQVTGQGNFSGHIGPTWVREATEGPATCGVLTGRLWVDDTPVLQSSGVWKILGA
ncbi:MAG: hypothetical protein P1U65_19080 [Minwuia sp.]|nr:hypothetical protein [Minwuia sp.]